MITKIDIHKIEYQPNIEIFVWNYDKFIESKTKQIINTYSRSITHWRIKLKKKLKKI